MHTRFGTALRAGLLGGAALAAPARADVIYTFTTTATANTFAPGAAPATLDLTLDLLDAAVQSGGVTLATEGLPPSGLFAYTAGAGDFRSLSFAVGGAGDTDTPASAVDILDISLTFATNGDVTASTVNIGGAAEFARISGTGAGAAGIVGTYDPAYSCIGGYYREFSTCQVSGSFTHSAVPVAEPSSLVLVGFGALVLAASRRRV